MSVVGQQEMTSRGASRPTRRRRRYRTGGVIRALAIVLLVAVLLTPLAWMVNASLKSNLQITNPAEMLSLDFTLQNFRKVFQEQNFLPFMVNSAIVGVVSTLISLILGAPAAYVIARASMRRSSMIILLARVLPGVSLLVPWYFVFSRLGMVGGYSVLILSHMFISLPLIVWILISFYEGIPYELEESGRVDGLTPIGAFVRIALPLSTPGLATSGILSLVFSWNNFMFALVLSSQNTRTLPVAIYNFVAYASIDWGGLMAASVIITVPVTIIGLVFQRHIVSGLTAGATKG